MLTQATLAMVNPLVPDIVLIVPGTPLVMVTAELLLTARQVEALGQVTALRPPVATVWGVPITTSGLLAVPGVKGRTVEYPTAVQLFTLQATAFKSMPSGAT
jgi:hypothetical protein